jgi:hypothetical protein
MFPDERMGLSLTITAGPHQRSHSQVQVSQDSWPHFTSSNSRLSQTGAQVTRNRVAQLYPPTLVSFTIAFYCSQVYGGGNSNLLHTLEGQSAMPWSINSGGPNTKHSTADFWRNFYMCARLKQTGLPNVYFCFTHIIVLDANLLQIILTIFCCCCKSFCKCRTSKSDIFL